jgi:hypothetical protein
MTKKSRLERLLSILEGEKDDNMYHEMNLYCRDIVSSRGTVRLKRVAWLGNGSALDTFDSSSCKP